MKQFLSTKKLFSSRRIFGNSPVFVTIFLMLCHFSFAGDIKIIGAIPKTDTGKTYQLQIGAFNNANNVNKAVETLKRNGLEPRYENVKNEKYGCLTRVFVIASAKDICFVINCLERAGFKEVIIREYFLKTEPDNTTVETKEEPPVDETVPEMVPEDEPPEVKILPEKQNLDFEIDPFQIPHLFLSLYSRQGGY